MRLSVAASLGALLALQSGVQAAMRNRRQWDAIRRDAIDKHANSLAATGRSEDELTQRSETETRKSTISFANPAAKAYHVNGKTIPDVNFDVGDSWAGLMPISAAKDETRKLFFWFFPSTNSDYTEDLVFWTNGGPGCSSLEGLLQENGPFKWSTGTAAPIPNQWAWTNLSHVLWVEQPVGTGFSQGIPNITNDDELAAQVAGFLNQFLDIFSELKHKNFYVSGESYAGFYVPYIANYLYEHPGLVPLNLKGTWMTDPSVSWDLVQQYIPALRFAQKWSPVFALNDSYIRELKALSDGCGFTDYYNTYVTYPPKGPLPLPSQAYDGIPNWENIASNCTLWDDIVNAEFYVNPNFNIYRVLDVWPVLWDVIGFPGSFLNTQSPIYFARRDVQNAIHAPHIEWTECTNNNVYLNGTDNSLPSMLSVMPNVIEKNQRTVVMHGGADYVLIQEGTRIAIQNMTWAGKQGFQTPIANESFVIEGFGALGTLHQERGLTYIEVNLSGHMMPEYAPWAAYKTLWYLLGRGEMQSTAIDVSLYPNNFQLSGSWDKSRAGGVPRVAL